MSGLGPPQLARITSRTDDTRPLASAAAKEHLCQDGIIVITIVITEIHARLLRESKRLMQS